jgi:hypothetical protein
MNRKTEPTQTHKRQNGEEKFTPLACSIRACVGCALTGNNNVPAFLTKMNISALYDIWRFIQSPAFDWFNRAGMASGGRALFHQRQAHAKEVRLAFSREEQGRFSKCLNLDSDTLGIEPEGWMQMS